MAFWKNLHVFGDSTALLDSGKSISYQQLCSFADDWANDICGACLPSRRIIVALEFETSVEAIAAYLGALRAGFPVLVLEPGQWEQASRIRELYAPDVVIRRRGGKLEMEICGTEQASPEPHPDLALLLSTSGTTGDPKLVRLSAQNISTNADSIVEYLELTSSDRAITTLPLFYSFGLSVLNSHLAAGAALVLTSEPVLEPAFWAQFREAGATSLAMVPHQLETLVRSGWLEQPLPTLRYISQAGGKLGPDLVRRISALGLENGWQLFVMYGQTEASPRISYVPPGALPDAADTIGIAIPGGRLRLIDRNGHEITAPGQPGELVYDGPNVMMGYAENRADLARPPETPELRTGDVAERTADGYFKIVGRMKRFVKMFGLRISLDQVEALLQDNGIAANAVAVEDKLVLLHRNAAQGDEARQQAASLFELPPAAIHVAHLAETPLLPSGNIDHRALQKLARSAFEEQSRDTGLVDIAALLLTATRALSVGPNDSFNSLGGDSLGYLHVQMGLEKALGRIPDDWPTMSLSELQALRPVETAGWTTVGMDVLLRIQAVGLIVAQHASDYPLYGGTWMLIILMGYLAGRFQSNLVAQGKPMRIGLRMLYPLLPLYAAILLAYSLAERGEIPHHYLVLTGNYHISPGGWLLGVYWFVGLFFQLVLVVMLLAALPPARNSFAARPWHTVMLVLAVSTAVMAMASLDIRLENGQMISSYPVDHLASRGFLECLPLFLAGWAIEAMRGRTQLLITMAAAAIICLTFIPMMDNPPSGLWIVATILLLASGWKLPAPLPVARFLQATASVSLFVYLLHQLVVHVLLYVANTHETVGALPTVAMAIVLSFLLAFLAKGGFDRADGQFMRLVRAVAPR